MSKLIRDGSHSFRKPKNKLEKLIAVGKKAQMRLVPALNGFRVVDLLNPVTMHNKPLSCGAHVWIETNNPVRVIK